IIVATRRHAEGSWGLSDQEAAGLGPLLRNLCSAVKTVTGAERVHVAAAGEVALHFHYLIMPRRPGEAPVLDSMEIARRMTEMRNPAQAAELGGRVRDIVARREAQAAGSNG